MLPGNNFLPSLGTAEEGSASPLNTMGLCFGAELVVLWSSCRVIGGCPAGSGTCGLQQYSGCESVM